MTSNDPLLTYVLRLADNALVVGQRLIERVAGEPELEEELANANFALDYIGQARMLYTYAGEIEGSGRTEDDFAFHRDSQEFRNFLLFEQPIADFGDKIVRQVFFESFYVLQLDALQACSNKRLAEIAARAVKEIRYHLRHVSQWLVRLGDGTAESHQRVQASVDQYWTYTGEMFAGDDVDATIQSEFKGPNLDTLHDQWQTNIAAILAEATLAAPEDEFMASGGRDGRHTEHLGYLIAEMQFLQRAYPGASW